MLKQQITEIPSNRVNYYTQMPKLKLEKLLGVKSQQNSTV
jgi:hypothetical protein